MKVIKPEEIPSLKLKSAALFIGSFNPTHIEHIRIINKALNYVDGVLVYPTGRNTNKDIPSINSRSVLFWKALQIFGKALLRVRKAEDFSPRM